VLVVHGVGPPRLWVPSQVLGATRATRAALEEVGVRHRELQRLERGLRELGELFTLLGTTVEGQVGTEGTGSDWEGAGGHWEGAGRDREGTGMNWEGIGGHWDDPGGNWGTQEDTGLLLEGTGGHWEGAGGHSRELG